MLASHPAAPGLIVGVLNIFFSRCCWDLLTGLLRQRFDNWFLEIRLCVSSGKILRSNVVAIPNVVEAAADADILIFVIPHQVGVTIDCTERPDWAILATFDEPNSNLLWPWSCPKFREILLKFCEKCIFQLLSQQCKSLFAKFVLRFSSPLIYLYYYGLLFINFGRNFAVQAVWQHKLIHVSNA